MMLDSSATNSSAYPNFDPPAIDVAQLPGSMYPTATMYPGPRNAAKRRQGVPLLATATVPWTSASERSASSLRQSAFHDAGAFGAVAASDFTSIVEEVHFANDNHLQLR